MIPAKEQKSYAELKHFTYPVEPEIDIAWSDVFPNAVSWLAKRERDKKEKERKAPADGINSGGFDFGR
jgi:hypothetical protein